MQNQKTAQYRELYKKDCYIVKRQTNIEIPISYLNGHQEVREASHLVDFPAHLVVSEITVLARFKMDTRYILNNKSNHFNTVFTHIFHKLNFLSESLLYVTERER